MIFGRRNQDQHAQSAQHDQGHLCSSRDKSDTTTICTLSEAERFVLVYRSTKFHNVQSVINIWPSQEIIARKTEVNNSTMLN